MPDITVETTIYRINRLCCIVFELNRGKPLLLMNRYDKFMKKLISCPFPIWFDLSTGVCTRQGLLHLVSNNFSSSNGTIATITKWISFITFFFFRQNRNSQVKVKAISAHEPPLFQGLPHKYKLTGNFQGKAWLSNALQMDNITTVVTRF